MYQFELLQKIGLSKTARRCYEALFTEGPATAEELGKRLELTVNGLYRVLEKLGATGFIIGVKPYGHSTRYTAYPVNKALKNYFAYQKQLVKPLSSQFPAEQNTEIALYKYLTEQINED